MGAVESIVAAAQRLIKSPKGGKQANTVNGLASLAWDFYETIPEVGAYADWTGNTLSSAQLFAGKRGPDGTVERAPDTSRAAQLVASIAGGPDGQSVLLGDYGTQQAVAGDCWLIIVPDPEADSFADDRWLILSTEEVSQQRGKIKAQIDGVDVEIPEYDPDAAEDADTPIAIRIWNQSPRRHLQATSPVIRSVAVLEELRLLNAAVAAIARSRITGRGVLLVPAGTRFPAQPGQEQAEDSLMETFIEVASTAIREPESAAATVPIVLEVPGDLISGVQWLQFSSEFDALAVTLREEAIRRFATGADIPPEVLLGTGQVNHWSAWQLAAEALRTGAEPKLGRFCQALTTEWMRPLLQAESDPEADEWMVWYDTASLRASSNKGASALEAYKLGIIGGPAARRELGFTEDDAPENEDTATTTTEGNELTVADTQTPPAIGLAASSVLDDLTAGSDAALAAAVDGLIWNALTVAGDKIMRTPMCPRSDRASAKVLVASASVHVRHPVTAADVNSYNLLHRAWDRVPEIAARYGVDPVTLTAALDEYTTALLEVGAAHNFDDVPRLLTRIRLGVS